MSIRNQTCIFKALLLKFPKYIHFYSILQCHVQEIQLTFLREIKKLLVLVNVKCIQRDDTAFAVWSTLLSSETNLIIYVWILRSSLKLASVLHLPLQLKIRFKTLLLWWISSRIYSFHVYIQLFGAFLCILIFKAPQSPVFTPSYNNREQSYLLSIFRAKKLRSGSDTGVNTTHHSVVNKDLVYLHLLHLH